MNFKVGDYVYASDWCYGEIVRIENEYADVEFDTGSGGGCLPFGLDELNRSRTEYCEVKFGQSKKI